MSRHLSDRIKNYLLCLREDYSFAIPQVTREFLKRAESARRAGAEEQRVRAPATAESEMGQHAELVARQVVEAEGAKDIQVAKVIDRLLRVFGLQRTPKNIRTFRRPPMKQSSVLPRHARPSTDGHVGGKFYTESEPRTLLAMRRSTRGCIRQQAPVAIANSQFLQASLSVALHLQPERSTNSLGGVLDEQYVIMISFALLSGWPILVKDIPANSRRNLPANEAAGRASMRPWLIYEIPHV